MKIAKPDEKDLEHAMTALGILSALERGDMPSILTDDEFEIIDTDDAHQYKRLIDGLTDMLNLGSLSRVIWGMATVCDPKNAVIDPDADSLELHPRILKALEAQTQQPTA